eukprot:TRINITY_DN2047_c0_g1_i2.p1 TRINITY_DN2047_c0_g1~~TRINITY_DN2047_c0_g1_i2.p1  ORF type:complete len:352 (+),score=48.75 TRINITY_DN2047_c0_g1_i2:130-1185(+)
MCIRDRYQRRVHGNIDKSVQRFNSQKVIFSLKQLQSIRAEDLKFNKEKWTAQLGTVLRLWKSLVKIDEFRKVKIRGAQLSSDDPIEGFVYMEFYNMQILMERIQETLEGLNNVLFGSGLLTSNIEKDATILLKNEVPSQWSVLWDGASSPVEYLRAFSRKANAMKSWLSKVKGAQILQEPLSLADLFHPGTFLNSLRQRSARALHCAINDLKLICSFEDRMVKSSSLIVLKDLLLQGGTMEGGQIKEHSEISTELQPLSYCYVAWVAKGEESLYPAKMTMDIPVYFSLNRESLLCQFKLPQIGDESDKIISGVAIFLQGTEQFHIHHFNSCLLYTSPSPRDLSTSRMPSSA